MINKYVPIIKTGDAELRGIDNLEEIVKDNITPIFELTRSRKTEKLREGSISRRLDKLEEVFGADRGFILDLTSDYPLINTEIRALQDSSNGYFNWCNFLLEQKKRFKKIIPMIQISEDESLSIEENNQNLAQQIAFFKKHFKYICYRININDEVYASDLEIIMSELGTTSKALLCCIDAVFVNRERAASFSQAAIAKIEDINTRFNLNMFSLAGTSFPKSVSQISDEDTADIALEEITFANNVINHFAGNSNINIIYGDYATINQERNEMFASGWIPRIDCPTEKLIFYYRKRRDGSIYAIRYSEVANMVIRDNRFKQLKKMIGCWGIEEIEYATKNKPGGLAPSFWISVRLNIHITLRDFLLNSSDRANLSS